EAPAAISLMEAKDISRNAGHGQLPKLIEAEPGVDMVQSGLYDFNVNTRGFNSSLNRRLLILLDGRDLGTAFLGATEWNGLTIPLEELGRIELVRGPGSALYGANAYNGVLNITSIPPRASQGTRVTLGVGELSMFRGDVRHAGSIGQWSYRVNAGGISGKTFSRVRRGARFEYPGFNPFLNDEVVDLNTDPVTSVYGSVRVDYDYPEGGVSTIEGGMAQVENEVIVTGIGRVQVQKAQRPWGRVSYTGHGLNVLLWATGRKNMQPERSLSTGLPLTQDATILHGEAQYHFSLLENSLFIVVGGSHRNVDVDTKGTLMLEPRTDNMSGFFAQAEYRILPNLKAVGAARWDRSTLHDSQISPKAAVVWSPFESHSLRATYNRAFQSPNYSEAYLFVKHPKRPLAYFGNLVTNPPGLVGFEGGAQPGPNKDLTVEKITGFEVGYKGVVGNSLYLTIDGYYNQMSDFVTDLAPDVNPKYPARALFQGDTLSPRTIWSYVNVGKVNEGGVEVGANFYLSEDWLIRGNFSYFSFEVLEQHLYDVLLPNTPSYRMGGGVTYTHSDGHDVGASIKYLPTFEWAAGIYQGTIPAYTVVDLSGSFIVSSNFTVNVNVSNLLDRQHYQIFGGSLLGRRAVATVTWTM
ncbi:MAG: TonB-dependent receptor, partial [Bacteroidota bacterium]